MRDNRDCIRVLLSFSYTTITGWGVLLGSIGIMEKKMETTIGFRVSGLGLRVQRGGDIVGVKGGKREYFGII